MGREFMYIIHVRTRVDALAGDFLPLRSQRLAHELAQGRSWGDGQDTEKLHHLGFDLHVELAQTLGLKSFRKVPTLSVCAVLATDRLPRTAGLAHVVSRVFMAPSTCLAAHPHLLVGRGGAERQRAASEMAGWQCAVQRHGQQLGAGVSRGAWRWMLLMTARRAHH
jgi:hypothetical protein